MVVIIGDNQWICSLASTYDELTQGLSGVESLPAGEGMLFNLGMEYSRVDINMQDMLFPLDIIFIDSDLLVVGVLHEVNPGDEAYFEASSTPPARYFIEVNAGEAASVNVGDAVTMQDGIAGGFDISSMFMVLLAVAVMSGMIRVALKK